MAIYKLIANGSFGPDEIEAMSAAYESALVYNPGAAHQTSSHATQTINVAAVNVVTIPR